ncbi:uncharacterized protein [Aquarana catesbeiana]|uniref:uncharacterized protein n=1 Tax=Aquarana catesbeiana TaxID=8400 RepID=UPI003CCA131F
MSGQSEFYVDGDYQESALSGSMSTQEELIQVQEMLEIIYKMETADQAGKSLSNESDLKVFVKGLRNHANNLKKGMWTVGWQIRGLTDRFPEVKGIKRCDRLLVELCLILMYLHNEFKYQSTQQRNDILDFLDKFEQSEKDAKIIMDGLHQISKKWEQLIEQRESFLQENESPDENCRVIGSGNLGSCRVIGSGNSGSWQESLIRQLEKLIEQMKFMPQGNTQIRIPERDEFDSTSESDSESDSDSDSESEGWESDDEEESEKESISYPKPSVEQRGVKSEAPHERGSNQFSLGSEKKTDTPNQDTAEIITFVNDAIPVFSDESDSTSESDSESDSEYESWESDDEEESEKESISYPKPSVEQRGVKSEPPHERGSNQFSLGSEKKTDTPNQDTAEIIKFVNDAVPVFSDESDSTSESDSESDSEYESWESDTEEESEKEPISYPKPSVEQRGVKSEPPHERGSNQFSLGSEKKTDTPNQDTAEIIKFVNDAVPVFKEEGSMCVIDHIETYENTLSVLGLDDDQSRINFLPWVFETKHRRFCESLKGLYGASWQEIKHRCHLKFGPYENVTAATAAIPNLRCNSNQSPNENLAVFKNASHVAEKEPDHNHPEFNSTFFEALPNYIKVSLAKDYKGGFIGVVGKRE